MSEEAKEVTFKVDEILKPLDAQIPLSGQLVKIGENGELLTTTSHPDENWDEEWDQAHIKVGGNTVLILQKSAGLEGVQNAMTVIRNTFRIGMYTGARFIENKGWIKDTD